MYKIYSDIAGDFNKEQIKRIEVIPAPFISRDEEIIHTLDYKNMSKEEFIKRLKSEEMSTTMVNQYSFESSFKEALKRDEDVLYIAFSSGLSAQCEQAIKAKEALEKEFPKRKIEIVDTLCATVGLEIIMDRALKNYDNGMTIEENKIDLVNFSKNVAIRFIVDDLMHLKRGGRLSAAQAFIGTAIKLKPILKIDENGKLVSEEKSRGTKSALKKLIEIYDRTKLDNQKKVVLVHCENLEAAISLKNLLIEKYNDLLVEIRELSPIIAVHTGVGLLAFAYQGVR